jgi:glycolate oxidase FAD binding subunit
MADQRLAARDAKDVEETLGWANANAKRVAVSGSGTKAAIGRPFEADATLSTAALTGVVAYEPSELVLTARPGTPVAEIETLLAQQGQRLAFEPVDHGPLLGGAPDRTTLGGVIGAAASGPRRLKAGGVRDHVLGFAAVSGRGEVFKAGGKVVKNVTGYDLAKLMAGSWGTLAVLTEVTLKVLPAPPEAETLLLPIASADAAARAMSAALGAKAEITGAAHLPAGVAARCPIPAVAGADHALTALRIEGVAPSIEASARAIRDALPDLDLARRLDGAGTEALWRWIRDVGAFHGDDRQVWRLSLAPMDGPAALAAIQAALQTEAYLDWAGGLVWLACGDETASGRIIRETAARLGGHATLIRASAASRQALGAFQPERPALAALSRRVKASFDPNGVLNPGRLWPLEKA